MREEKKTFFLFKRCFHFLIEKWKRLSFFLRYHIEFAWGNKFAFHFWHTLLPSLLDSEYKKPIRWLLFKASSQKWYKRMHRKSFAENIDAWSRVSFEIKTRKNRKNSFDATTLWICEIVFLLANLVICLA